VLLHLFAAAMGARRGFALVVFLDAQLDGEDLVAVKAVIFVQGHRHDLLKVRDPLQDGGIQQNRQRQVVQDVENPGISFEWILYGYTR